MVASVRFECKSIREQERRLPGVPYALRSEQNQRANPVGPSAVPRLRKRWPGSMPTLVWALADGGVSFPSTIIILVGFVVAHDSGFNNRIPRG